MVRIPRPYRKGLDSNLATRQYSDVSGEEGWTSPDVQSFQKSTIQLFSQSIGQSFSQLITQSDTQLFSQSYSQSVTQSLVSGSSNQWVTRTDRRTDGQTDSGQTDGQTDRQADRQTDGQTDGQADVPTDKKTDRKTNRETGRQTDNISHAHLKSRSLKLIVQSINQSQSIDPLSKQARRQQLTLLKVLLIQRLLDINDFSVRDSRWNPKSRDHPSLTNKCP